MINIIINGFLGHMGQALYSAILARPNEFRPIAGVDVAASEGESYALPCYSDINNLPYPTGEAGVVIDFSRPESVESVLPYCKKHSLIAIIGTTALNDACRQLMDSYASSVPIFTSGNMSLGVNLQLQLIKSAAKTLKEAFEPEIIEKHHHFKVDSPSGTALMLADAISSQFPEGKVYKYGRYTRTERRRSDELGIHSVRGGTITGEHEVYFIGTDEVLEINHRAYSKQIFVQGALRAATFMQGKMPGLYGMRDIVLEGDMISHLYIDNEQCIIRVGGLNATHNALREVFDALASRGIFVDMISMARYGEVSFTVRDKQRFAALEALESLKPQHKLLKIADISDITKITVEGSGMEFSHGVASKVFGAIADAGIDVLLVTTSETKISLVVGAEHTHRALNALEDCLEL